MMKGTIIIPSGTESDPDRRHLFVVLNEPVGPDELVLLASFSTVSPNYFCDPTCIIEAGDSGHPFLTKRSFVRYQKLRIEAMDKLRAGLSTGAFVQMDPLSDTVFLRVLQGAMDSPFSPPKCKRFLESLELST